MAWRCQSCDYLGDKIIETEETDTCCPVCGEDCIEYNEMSQEEETILANFFDNNLDSFIRPNDDIILDDEELYFNKLLWEDFDKAKEVASRENIYVYTVVECEGEEAWIIKDWHYVNRIGYYFTTKNIVIPEEGIRYW